MNESSLSQSLEYHCLDIFDVFPSPKSPVLLAILPQPNVYSSVYSFSFCAVVIIRRSGALSYYRKQASTHALST